MLPFKNYNTINTNRIKTFSITTTVKNQSNQSHPSTGHGKGGRKKYVRDLNNEAVR